MITPDTLPMTRKNTLAAFAKTDLENAEAARDAAYAEYLERPSWSNRSVWQNCEKRVARLTLEYDRARVLVTAAKLARVV
jgi:hypothetical protein